MNRFPNRLACGAAAVALGFVTGCGSDDSGAQSAATPATSTTPPTTAGASAGSGAGASASAAAGPGTTLTGTVGTSADPDAFVITLTDSAGKQVRTLKSGSYRISVRDLSKIHNFHFKGAGVDKTTTVPAVTDSTFDVTLQPGDYTFMCDPHPRMVGKVTVT